MAGSVGGGPAHGFVLLVPLGVAGTALARSHPDSWLLGSAGPGLYIFFIVVVTLMYGGIAAATLIGRQRARTTREGHQLPIGLPDEHGRDEVTEVMSMQRVRTDAPPTAPLPRVPGGVNGDHPMED